MKSGIWVGVMKSGVGVGGRYEIRGRCAVWGGMKFLMEWGCGDEFRGCGGGGDEKFV